MRPIFTTVRNSRAFGGEGVFELGEGLEQFPGREDRAELDRGGVDVVGGLAEVDVVVGVQPGVVALRVPEDFQGPVGDDLVGVHVRGGPGAALDDVDDELLAEFAVHDLGAGLPDGGGTPGVEQSELVVGAGGGEFHGGQPADQVHVGGQRLAGDGEVLHGPEGVDAPVGVGGNIPVAQEVVFGAGVRGGMGVGHWVLTGLR